MATQKMETDVVFVGGGSAGLCGAVRAGELGLGAVVLEKLGSCGGDAMIAAGYWVAAGTALQKEKGIMDTGEALYRYFMEFSAYKCRPDLIQVLADRAAANIQWLEKQGLPMTKGIVTQGTAPVPRVHQNEGMGGQYVRVMKERAEALGARILLKTGATSLILEGDKVTGVMAQIDGGDTLEIRAKGVVLCTGGFGKNKEMLEEHLPFKRHVMVCAGWAQGDGVRLARQAGAAIADLNVCIGYKGEVPETAALAMRGYFILMASNYAVVNKRGERFMDESIWVTHFANALNTQPDATGYIILDEALRTGNPFTKLEKEVESGRVKKADSFEALAVEAGLPKDRFTATMERYNRFANTGKDEDFGKQAPALTPVAQPPFYAMEIVPLVLNTAGGAVIDAGARVLRPDGTAIPGLYAAGNNTAFFYTDYPSTGTGLQISSIFGQVAVETIKHSL